MIAMLPLRDKSVLDALNAAEHTAYHLAYCLYEGGERTGYLLYNANPATKEAHIGIVRAESDPVADGIIRATFGSLMDIGIDRATFDDGVDAGLLERLELTDPGTRVTSSIQNVLMHCKNCKK